MHIKGQHSSCTDGSHFLEKWTLEAKKLCQPSAANRQHIFFKLKKVLLSSCCLENSFPDNWSQNFFHQIKQKKWIVCCYDCLISYYIVLNQCIIKTNTATESNDIHLSKTKNPHTQRKQTSFPQNLASN